MARNPLGGRYSARTSSTASISTRRQRPRVGPRRTPLRAAARILDARSGPGLSFQRLGLAHARAFDRRALFVQLSAALAVLFAIAAAFSLFALELRFVKPRRRIMQLRQALCIAAACAPLALLLCCVGLLWLFQPYAQILRSARSLTSASAAWHSLHFEGLFTRLSALWSSLLHRSASGNLSSVPLSPWLSSSSCADSFGTSARKLDHPICRAPPACRKLDVHSPRRGSRPCWL